MRPKLAPWKLTTILKKAPSYGVAKDIVDRIAYFISQGMSPQEAELKGVEDYAVECSLIKVGASEDLQNCSDEGIQIFGGMGFSAEAPIESAWRDARIGRIYEGTNEINRMLSIGMILKKAMRGELDIMSAYQNIIENKSQETLENSEELNDEITLVENMKKVFLLLLGKSFEKFGAEIDKNQQVLLSLSDLAIETYISESTLKRTIKNINRTSANDQEYQISMSKIYIYEASKIIEKKSRDIINSVIDDKSQEKNYDSVLNKFKYSNNPNIFELKTNVANKVIAENQYCF